MPYFRLSRKKLCTLLAAMLAISAPLYALKPTHEADRLLLAAKHSFADNNYTQAAVDLKRAANLGTALPHEFDYLFGKLLAHENNHKEALFRLERYVSRTNSEGQYYNDALSLITSIEKKKTTRNATPTSTSTATPNIHWQEANHSYIANLQDIYKSRTTMGTLTAHINSLLKFYAYNDPRIKASRHLGIQSKHTIRTSHRGELISINQFGTRANSSYSEEKFSVYGVNPYINYHCSQNYSNCWILHPVTSKRWLQVVNNEGGVDELAKALTLLIRQMQKRA